MKPFLRVKAWALLRVAVVSLNFYLQKLILRNPWDICLVYISVSCYNDNNTDHYFPSAHPTVQLIGIKNNIKEDLTKWRKTL